MPRRTASAAAAARELTSSLGRMLLTWAPTVRRLRKRTPAISRSGRPSTIRRSTSNSRGVRLEGAAGVADFSGRADPADQRPILFGQALRAFERHPARRDQAEVVAEAALLVPVPQRALERQRFFPDPGSTLAVAAAVGDRAEPEGRAGHPGAVV